jgi:hypothetical protein
MTNDGTCSEERWCFYIHICMSFKMSGSASEEWKKEIEKWLKERSA